MLVYVKEIELRSFQDFNNMYLTSSHEVYLNMISYVCTEVTILAAIIISSDAREKELYRFIERCSEIFSHDKKKWWEQPDHRGHILPIVSYFKERGGRRIKTLI